MVELTIPYNSMENISNSRIRKSTKEIYQQDLSDLDSNGCSSTLLTIRRLVTFSELLLNAHS